MPGFFWGGGGGVGGGGIGRAPLVEFLKGHPPQ